MAFEANGRDHVGDQATRGGRASEDIARILGEGKVRVLTDDQTARYWFGHTKEPKRHALRCVRQLQRQGVVKLSRSMLWQIDVSEPLFRWPEDGTPNCGQIAWRARKRFEKSLPVSTVTIFPGENLSGSRKRLPRSTELQHDAMMSSVFLNVLVSDATIFDKWRLEDEVREMFREERHIPDAVVFENDRQIFVECIGKYGKAKLEAIHEAFCPIPYLFF